MKVVYLLTKRSSSSSCCENDFFSPGNIFRAKQRWMPRGRKTWAISQVGLMICPQSSVAATQIFPFATKKNDHDVNSRRPDCWFSHKTQSETERHCFLHSCLEMRWLKTKYLEKPHYPQYEHNRMGQTSDLSKKKRNDPRVKNVSYF